MKTDVAIKQEGLEALNTRLGIVDAERFIALINREKFNYTEWRKSLFADMSVEQLAEAADEFSIKMEQ